MIPFLAPLIPFALKALTIFQFALAKSIGPFLIILSNLMFKLMTNEAFVAKMTTIAMRAYSKTTDGDWDDQVTNETAKVWKTDAEALNFVYNNPMNKPK